MRKFNHNPYISSIIVILIMLTMSCSSGYNKHADQYYEEGILFYERMEYERSIENFDKVLELAPYGKDNNLVYFNRGMAHLKNRQYDKSIYDLTKALELTSNSDNELKFDIFAFRGEAYQKNNELDNAIKDYSEAVRLKPKHKNIKYIYSSRAWVWFAKKDYTMAINDFGKAIKVDPELDEAYFGRASCWYEKKDFQRALVDAKEAVRLKPANKKYEDLLFRTKSAMDQK
jgi:tetratricopeptide (TPR) repeat protein